MVRLSTVPAEPHIMNTSSYYVACPEYSRDKATGHVYYTLVVTSLIPVEKQVTHRVRFSTLVQLSDEIRSLNSGSYDYSVQLPQFPNKGVMDYFKSEEKVAQSRLKKIEDYFNELLKMPYFSGLEQLKYFLNNGELMEDCRFNFKQERQEDDSNKRQLFFEKYGKIQLLNKSPYTKCYRIQSLVNHHQLILKKIRFIISEKDYEFE